MIGCARIRAAPVCRLQRSTPEAVFRLQDISVCLLRCRHFIYIVQVQIFALPDTIRQDNVLKQLQSLLRVKCIGPRSGFARRKTGTSSAFWQKLKLVVDILINH